MRKALFILLTMFILCMGLLLTGCKATAATEEEVLLQLVNEQRQANGLKPLSIDSELMQAAQIRADEASVKYSHERPDGSSCFTVSNKAYGENLAKANAYNTLDEVVEAWMLSKAHKDNILYASSDKTGFGICKLADGTYYVAELFN